MNTNTKRLLFWTPRVLCILLAILLGLFVLLEAFSEGFGFWQTLAALLFPGTFVIAVVIAWRWEWVGAVLFIALALFFLVSSLGRMHWSTYVIIPGPLFLVGILFLLNWKYRAQLRTR